MTATAEKITELEGKLNHQRQKLADVFEQAGEKMDMSKVTLLEGNSGGKVDGIRALNEQINATGAELRGERAAFEREQREELEANEPIDRSGRAGIGARRIADEKPKSLGEAFVESDAYKLRPKGAGYGPTSEVMPDGGPGLQATLFQRSAGWAADSLRTGIVVPFALAPIAVYDLFPEAEISTGSLEYYEVTTFTNNAASRAEAAAYAESALAFTKRTATVESTGTSLPVTDEQLADRPQARSFVDGALTAMVKIKLNNLLVNGDGNTPNILGILNAANLQTQAKASDTTPDALFKALQKIRNIAFTEPTAFVMNPSDWTPIRLLATDDGIYIWGNPALAGGDTIWGLPVVQEAALAAGTAIAGSFLVQNVQLYVREGIEVQVGYVNDDFLKGKQTIRAGVRVAPAYYRGSAFCSITGL